VFRGGDFDAHSSEDDEDTQPQLDLPEGLLQMDTPGDEEFQQRPATAAFCRAVDREEEYDAVDEVAQGRDSTDDRPAGSTQVRMAADSCTAIPSDGGHTACDGEQTACSVCNAMHPTLHRLNPHWQVLPDNAYEREGSPALAEAAQPSGAEAVDFGHCGEPPIRQPSPVTEAHRNSVDDSGTGTRKRVRFAAYVPPQQRSAEGTGLAQVWMLTYVGLRHRHEQQMLSGTAAPHANPVEVGCLQVPWAGVYSSHQVFHCMEQLNVEVALRTRLYHGGILLPYVCRVPAASGPRSSSGPAALPVAPAAQARQPCRSMCSTQTDSRCTNWMNR
jgi:hypothetical protein